MIDELKRGMKLLKYGFNLKSSILLAVLFFLMGIVFIGIDNVTFLLGGTYIMLGPMMLIQIVVTLISANSVAASPRKRVLEIWIPNLAGLVIMILGYICIIAIAVLKIYQKPALENDYLNNLACMGMLTCILGIYMSISYKSFLMSILGIALAYPTAYVLFGSIKIHLTIVTASLIGFAFIVLGSILSFMLRKAFYKKPISKYAVGGALRKYM